ncbi:hypothetical protein ACIG0C_03575 [Kitasatospora aureofaciens]|uniref:Uncharacterized protein n=1 Tax=Kitasatospora aureofaciens TaxID=1894 RepID=A0A1E7N1I2_KITAU|nr:hypothetical protein [Kitasatospora aureofaciens]QEU99936.1 hypothetical protein CP971_12115 [Streptomyces viridifaciens]ARF78730.1 hypothetical protein B6264_07180 [Kitasatospora aureofaciens]OEV34323.1 hypothetical protein HS99_0036355 [Kitasatospora aureofaciens]UKZ06092.1 hypothetical protein BOQ63_019000 [Streptomyces viridifaciens]GGU77910.1 hypothetical protein GCM10010502_32300 [Kitasatospora aureofaciens]
MHIKWNALAQTAGISFGVTVAVVAVFALGILALSRREAALGARQAADGQASGGRPALLAGAYACFALCAAAVAYGLVLIAAP